MAVTYQGRASTLRTPGRAATAQVYFTIANKTGSGVNVHVKRLSVQHDTAAIVNVSWANTFKVARVAGTVPANGTVMTKVPAYSALSSAANVELRGDASADGTSSAAALTAAFTTVMWQQFVQRMHTAVGQAIFEDEPLIPGLSETEPVILVPNEALVVALAANATAANGATAMTIINCAWDEVV